MSLLNGFRPARAERYLAVYTAAVLKITAKVHRNKQTNDSFCFVLLSLRFASGGAALGLMQVCVPQRKHLSAASRCTLFKAVLF